MSVLVHGRTSAFDLRLRDGERAQGRLERILVARGGRVEVKSEPKCRDTGNICVEFEQRNPAGGSKPSGIATSEAEWWAIEYLPNRWLILPRTELLTIARAEYRISGARDMGDNGNRGVLVPLTSLIDPFMVGPHERACAACRRQAA